MPLGLMYGTLGKVHCGMRDGTLGKARCGMRESGIPKKLCKTGRDERWMSSLSYCCEVKLHACRRLCASFLRPRINLLSFLS